MTVIAKEKTLQELMDTLQLKADAVLNIMDRAYTSTELENAKQKATDALNDYNAKAVQCQYDLWKEADYPLLTAVLARYVQGTMKLSYKRDRTTGAWKPPVTSVEGVKSPKFNPYDFIGHGITDADTACGSGVWKNYITAYSNVSQALIRKRLKAGTVPELTIRHYKTMLGFTPGLGDDLPSTGENMVIGLQKCVDAIVTDVNGEQIPVTRGHVEFILSCLQEEGTGIGKITAKGAFKMGMLIIDVINMALNGVTCAELVEEQ